MSSIAPITRRGILAHPTAVPWSLALLLTLLRPAGVAGEGPPAVLDFLQPTNHAVFSTTDEVPIMLRASAPDDVFLSAGVFGNSQPIASVSYCCSLCPCARPQPGQETILQIPVPVRGPTSIAGLARLDQCHGWGVRTDGTGSGRERGRSRSGAGNHHGAGPWFGDLHPIRWLSDVGDSRRGFGARRVRSGGKPGPVHLDASWVFWTGRCCGVLP